MDDEQVMHALNLDDLYRAERTLAKGAGGLTELVTLGGAGPFVRKKTPLKLANQNVWAAIGSVDCPRVPKVQSTYLLPDQFVVVYSYVPGQTLQELVLSSGPLTTGKAAKLATEICEAAEALHACGVIHRDLSPRNIIVAADGAHLIDLGIARMHVDGATNDTTFLGTHGFAAPEQHVHVCLLAQKGLGDAFAADDVIERATLQQTLRGEDAGGNLVDQDEVFIGEDDLVEPYALLAAHQLNMVALHDENLAGAQVVLLVHSSSQYKNALVTMVEIARFISSAGN